MTGDVTTEFSRELSEFRQQSFLIKNVNTDKIVFDAAFLLFDPNDNKDIFKKFSNIFEGAFCEKKLSAKIR